jgi:uroporphyrinogen-III synthase
VAIAGRAEIERARLESDNSLLAEQLTKRAVLDRAKGIVQRTLNLTEDDAYRIIRREAMDRRKTLHEIAKSIVLTYESRPHF